MEFEEGIRRNTSVFFGPDELSYHFNRTLKGGRESFRCKLYRSMGCKGRCSVNAFGEEFRLTTRHSRHPTARNFRQARQLRSAILTRCRSGDVAPLNVIYHDERRRLRTPPRAVALVPFMTLRPSMLRARKENLPPVPHTLEELDVILSDPDYADLTATFDGEDSLYAGTFGNANDETLCSVFVSERMREYMGTVRKVFSDATFKVVPAIGAYQCWHIVTLRRHHIIPMVRVFMQKKTETAYIVAMEAIHQLVPNFHPQEVMCDFEAAQQNAWRRVFRPQELHGCYFHSTKDMTMWARMHGLARLIVDNREIENIVRSSCALALLPPDRLADELMALTDKADEEGHWDILQEYFGYLLQTWVSKGEVFSVYMCEDRTSNACESDNKSLQDNLQIDHPGIFRFLEVLILMEERAWNDIGVLNAGGTLGQRKATAVANDHFIRAYTEDLLAGDIDLVTFLRRASRRVQNVHLDVLGLEVAESDEDV